ncbi:MAG TPA: hypothetical protein GX005_03625 [Bacteroidales bacterium]|nr:hypothetical protein [Bacteroidales bacterium]
MEFVDFTGEENELEFLNKCLKQWDIATEQPYSDLQKLMNIGTVFSEMRHRIEELEGEMND